MSVIVLGLSHRSAPMSILESVALSPQRAGGLAEAVQAGENVGEAVVVATCNRVEVYADALTFHGAVNQIGEALSAATGVELEELREHLYVHYEDRAVAHLFSVACGLDSMAVGESQILGQLRDALRTAQEQGRTGSALSGLFQHALRVGKRAHAETDIDTVSRSLVQTALLGAADALGDLSDARVLVVGAGAMSGLAAATVARHGVGDLVVVNRTRSTADRLAATTGGSAVDWADLPAVLPTADLVVSCTGALGHVIDTGDIVHSTVARAGRPQMYVDLALPRDVDPAGDGLAGVTVIGLAELAGQLDADGEGASAGAGRVPAQVTAVQDLVTAEVAAYLTGRRAKEVAPTVAALRSRAADVVAAELARLEQRVPALDEADRAEIQLAVHRVVEKLLHTPTVRVKELAGTEGSGDYAQALRKLFDLDAHEVAVVSVPPAVSPREGGLP